MKVTKGKAAELYQALIESARVEPMDPDEFTAKQFAKDANLSDSAANGILHKQMAEGRISRRHLGANRFVYRFTDQA